MYIHICISEPKNRYKTYLPRMHITQVIHIKNKIPILKKATYLDTGQTIDNTLTID